MGTALNELSDFDKTDLVKCGEVFVSSKQNDFLFGCFQCSGIFSQMPVFARHLQWEHQSDKVLSDEQNKDISVYTVEELLSYDDVTTDVHRDEPTDEGIKNTADEDDDTGIDSDVELEKEIEELLTSMGRADSFSGHDTEYSQSDSGVESRNNTDQYGCVSNLLDSMQPKKGQGNKVESKVGNIWKNLDDGANKLQTAANSLESEEEFDSMENGSSLYLEEANSTNESLSNEGESADDGIHMNYAESSNGEMKDDAEEKLYNPIGNKEQSTTIQGEETAFRSKNMKIGSSNAERLFDIENQKINDKDKTNTVINEESTTVQDENLLGLDHECFEELNLLRNEIECGRGISEDAHFINVVLSGVAEDVQKNRITDENLISCDDPKSDDSSDQDSQSSTKINHLEEPYVIEEVDDEFAEIQFSKEEIDQMKACMPEGSPYNLKETEFDIKTQAPNLSGFQMEYVGFNESAASIQCAMSQVVEADDSEEPLDLSFGKNALVTDIQLPENSDLLGCASNDETSVELITTHYNKLMAHKSTSTDNSKLSFDYDNMQCESIEGHQLPPFSKFFKNTANTLRTNNGFPAQSTPKQKHANRPAKNKTENDLKNSAQIDLNAKGSTELANNFKDLENVIPSPLNIDLRSGPQRKCKILKRFAKTNEKKNKPKKKKPDFLIAKENAEAKESDKKPEIQILSVDIIVPGGNNLRTENPLTSNSASIKPKIDELCSVEKLEITRTEKCERIAYGDKSQYVADSTSEYPTTSFSEINYTPEDTLNQLKLDAASDKLLFDSVMQNSFNATVPLNCNINQSSLIDGNSLLEESLPSTTSEEEKENYLLLRSLGLKIIADANAEDGLKLEHLETMRAKASNFAEIYVDFKYLWKVAKGTKSYEQLELDFNKLMHRINEKFELELTIAHTKRIINLISLWYMQTYHKWLIDKKPALDTVCHYLQLFKYLPKTARRIFYCEECPRYFLAQQKYLSHREKHMSITPSCPYCQTIFESRSAQLLHTTVCTTFKCIECAFKFENAASLEYHVRSKHLLQCEKCGKLCSSTEDLDWHEHQFPIICGLCNRFFDTPTDLQKHRQDSFHWDYTCRTCEVFLPTATQMKQHLSVCSGI